MAHRFTLAAVGKKTYRCNSILEAVRILKTQPETFLRINALTNSVNDSLALANKVMRRVPSLRKLNKFPTSYYLTTEPSETSEMNAAKSAMVGYLLDQIKKGQGKALHFRTTDASPREASPGVIQTISITRGFRI